VNDGCHNCRFFSITRPAKRHPEAGIGFCKRWPPSLALGKPAEQPEILGANWCGEFKAAPETEHLGSARAEGFESPDPGAAFSHCHD
jgi:hypothetical protein